MGTQNNSDLYDCIGVIGAGYVGLVAGACFSALGFTVNIVEIDPKKVERLRKGVSTIYEPGLSEIIEDSLAANRLQFSNSTRELFEKATPGVVFVAVGTPENPDGSCNMNYVFAAVKDVVEAAKNDVVLVIKSTVPVGTARKVKEYIATLSPKFRFAVVNNPEFLKEGSAIADFMRPERVVLGGLDSWAVDKVKALYESFLHNGHPLFVTDHESAELSKLASNLMLASRISLVNQVSQLSAKVGADIKQIEAIMRSDTRIGGKYLYAGLGYGGSCFPKDVKSFIHQCHLHGVNASMAEVVDSYNDVQKSFFTQDILKKHPKASSTTICLWGVAFKPNTDDIRESPALVLTEELTKAGYKVQAYDPKATEQYAHWLSENKLSEKVKICNSAVDAVQGADVLVLVTEWPEFQRIGLEKLKTYYKGNTIYDGKNIYNPARITQAGFNYVGVGRSRALHESAR